MRKLFFTALLATALFGISVGTASARNLSLLNGERGFLIEWARLEMSNNVNSEVVTCHVHLEGSFTARSIVKRDRAVIGSVTRAVSNSCTGGTGIPSTLPWRVRYRGFSGTLPIITLIFLDIPDLQFNIETAGGTRCESNAEDANPARGRAVLVEDGAGLRKITEIRADETVGVPLRGGIFGSCGLARGFFRGTATTNVLGESAAISVALI